MIDQYDFHDGYLFDVKSGIGELVLSMESAEISDEGLDDHLLSEHGTIKGQLHLEGVECIRVNGQRVDTLQQQHDCGDIFDFKIKENIVFLVVRWINYHPKQYLETDFFKIEIQANNIYWENIPDLANPFW